jgi:hypothetical protein
MKGDVENMQKETIIAKSMIGYIDRNQNVIAVEHSWNLGHPKDLGKFLQEKYPTKEDAEKLVEGGIVVLKEEPKAYQGVEGFGEVICHRLAMDKTLHRPHIEFLYCHMTGVWKVSDSGIDWEPIDEYIASEEASKKRMAEIKAKKVMA